MRHTYVLKVELMVLEGEPIFAREVGRRQDQLPVFAGSGQRVVP